MVQILAALGKVTDVLQDVGEKIKEYSDVIIDAGLYGAGGMALSMEQKMFQKIESIPFFQKNNINFGSQYMTPFGGLQYWTEIQKNIRLANQRLGVAGAIGKEIEQNIIAAGTAAMQLGITEGEIVEGLQEFSQTYERPYIISKDDMQRMAMVRKGFQQGYEKLFATNKLYGQNIKDTYKFIDLTNKKVNEFGLSSKKIMDTITDNIGLIDRFNFARGRTGLADMAILSSRLGVNLESAASFAEKIYKPEGAIEAAASLQMLGGEFAKFGDAYTLLGNAGNDLPEIAKGIADMTRGMAKFNQETGEFEVSSLNMRQLRAAAEGVNIPFQELVKTSKLIAKEDFLKSILSPELLRSNKLDETLSKLAGLADFKNMTVDILGTTKMISEITTADIAKLSQISVEQDEDSIKGLIKYNRTTADNTTVLANVFTRMSNPLVDGLARGEKTMQMVNDVFEKSLNGGTAFTIANATATFSEDAENNMHNVLTRLFTEGFGGASDEFLHNMSINNDQNTKNMVIHLLGGADTFLGKSFDTVADIQSTLMDGIGYLIEGMGTAITNFGDMVNKLTNPLGEDRGAERQKHEMYLKNIMRDNTFVAPDGFFGSMKRYNNPLELSRKYAELQKAHFGYGGGFIGEDPSVSNKSNNEKLLQLFKENEEVRKEFEYQMRNKSEVEIKASNGSQRIDFFYNGQVFDAYDLFENPKFIEMLKRDVGEGMANIMLGKTKNGGKNVNPSNINPR